MTLRRILFTGATGFVGVHLAQRLAAAFPNAELVPCGAEKLDIADAAAVLALLRKERPNVVVHLAAISSIAGAKADPARVWQVNLHGTLALANAILRESPECLLLHVSSADCYGRSFASGEPLDEQAPLAPINLYAATKAAADLALGAMIGEGLRCVRVRPFNHTGPGQSPAFVVAAFARQIARIAAGLQPPRLQVGALDPRREFLDVRDICDAYIACLHREEDLPRAAILNLASGVPRRIGDVLDQLLAIADIAAEVDIEPALLRPSEISLAQGNASAARTVLDWAPRIPWEQTLRDIMDDWRARVRSEP